jgi:hypothetical protein
MGVIRSISAKLAEKFTKPHTAKVQGGQPVKLRARVITDDQLKQSLADCIAEAQQITGSSKRITPKNMGMAHASDRYKKGWYIFIENFGKLSAAKSSKNDQFVRFIFRIVSLQQDPTYQHLEVLVWHPSHGNADQMRLVFSTDLGSGRDMFVQIMATAMSLTSQSPASP